MSWLVGTGQELFGSGGGQELADEIGSVLLGRVPLDPALREAADAGRTVFEAAPDSEAASALNALAERVQAARQGQIRKALTLLSERRGAPSRTPPVTRPR
jgi:ATP-binding protein involved in chromosome partitioning